MKRINRILANTVTRITMVPITTTRELIYTEINLLGIDTSMYIWLGWRILGHLERYMDMWVDIWVGGRMLYKVVVYLDG